jgi:hypothetical protein
MPGFSAYTVRRKITGSRSDLSTPARTLPRGSPEAGLARASVRESLVTALHCEGEKCRPR